MKPPRGGGLWVRQENGTHCARPNKSAAGFTRTAARRSGLNRVNHTDYGLGAGKLLPLIVHGTLDALAGGYMFAVRRVPCAHCGSRHAGHLAPTDNGRARLARARTRTRKAIRGALAAYRVARDAGRAFDEERAAERLRALSVPAYEWDRDTY